MSKYLENLKECIAIIFHQPCFSEKQKEQIIGTIIEVCEKAEKYDELQTPKRPKRKRLYYNCHNGECDKTFIHYCPICNFSSVEKDYANYCPNCGQKLDWSDKDE